MTKELHLNDHGFMKCNAYVMSKKLNNGVNNVNFCKYRVYVFVIDL